LNGAIVFVVGPSGAGKDSLLRYAAGQLSGDERFVFPRRVVTRIPEDTEDHDTMSPEDFRNAAAEGGFALFWRAHGLGYGIPIAIEADLEKGRTVAVNVSRNVLAEAIGRYRRPLIVVIEAPDAVLAERLGRRGRERGSEIDARIARTTAPLPPQARHVIINNNGALPVAGEAFVELLRNTQTP